VPTNGTGEVKTRNANMHRRASPPDCVYTNTTEAIGDGMFYPYVFHRFMREKLRIRES
jgi:hypothetical protein